MFHCLDLKFEQLYLKLLLRRFCFVLLISTMPIDNMLWYARIGVFQSPSSKRVPKAYPGSTLNLRSHKILMAYLSLCTLWLLCWCTSHHHL